uniref:Endonuclease/exonuclease/phosphatase domain-containing protein n=1 Tax=Proboscia inermis TaxID=420281 RepID=A0A7S0GLZ9_9STRA
MNFAVDEINKGKRFDDDQCCNEVVTFVVGDFNTQPNSTSFVLMEKEGFVDLRHLLSPESSAFDNSNVTTTDWYGSPDTMIDYIWLFQNNNTNNRHHSKSLINPGSHSTATNTNTNRNQFHYDNSGGDVKSYHLGKIPIVVTNVYHLSLRTHGNIDKNNTKMSNQQERVEKLPTTQQHSNSSLQFPSLISLSAPVAINEKTVAEQNHLNTASDHMMIVMDVKWKTTTPSASTTRQAPL